MATAKFPFMALLLVFGLAGCGTGTGSQTGNPSAGTTSNTTPQSSQPVQTAQTTTAPEAQTKQVVLFFPDAQLMKLYKEKQDITYTNEKDLPAKALEAWIKGAKSDKLTRLLPADVKVEHVKDLGNKQAEVSFSKEIRKANLGSTGESMVTKAVPLILQQFGYNETKILVEGKADDTFFSHMGGNKSFKAEDPQKYEFVK